MLETVLHYLPAKGFLFKNTRKAVQQSGNPTTYVCISTSACCKITVHTCADRCCALGCMLWQQLCVEMTTGVNSAREQWSESAGLSPKKCANKIKHFPVLFNFPLTLLHMHAEICWDSIWNCENHWWLLFHWHWQSQAREPYYRQA